MPGHGQVQDTALALQKLQRDPSIRLTDNGRLLLRWLAGHAIHAKDWEDLQTNIPAHSISLVTDLALGYAEEWKRFAEVLKRKRVRENSGHSNDDGKHRHRDTVGSI